MSTTAARRRVMRTIIGDQVVTSQTSMVGLLRDHGFAVTQATVSRDLKAIGAVKEEDRYILSDRSVGDGNSDALARAIDDFAESIVSSGRMAVIRTPPGAAQIVAAAIDLAHLDGVLGTIAGDDTLLVVAASDAIARKVSKYLEEIGVPT